jgi:predicted RNA-binding protein YlxR (DUF448 family)
MLAKTDLTRVVKSPDNKVILDEKGNKQGRGAYLCKKPECYKKAIKSNAFNRALRTKVPESILEEIRV